MNNDTPDGTAAASLAPARTARWVKVTLFASLALNLLVVGAVVGRTAMGPPYFRSGHEGWEEAREVFRELPRERRGVILDQMRSHRGAFDDHRRRIGDARRRAAETVERADADDAEIRAAFEALGREEADGVIALRQVIGEVTLIMTPQERRLFAERILGREPRMFGPHWEVEDD